jgi:hypothetical protein
LPRSVLEFIGRFLFGFQFLQLQRSQSQDDFIFQLLSGLDQGTHLRTRFVLDSRLHVLPQTFIGIIQYLRRLHDRHPARPRPTTHNICKHLFSLHSIVQPMRVDPLITTLSSVPNKRPQPSKVDALTLTGPFSPSPFPQYPRNLIFPLRSITDPHNTPQTLQLTIKLHIFLTPTHTSLVLTKSSPMDESGSRIYGCRLLSGKVKRGYD